MLCNFKNIIPGLEIYGKENYIPNRCDIHIQMCSKTYMLNLFRTNYSVIVL